MLKLIIKLLNPGAKSTEAYALRSRMWTMQPSLMHQDIGKYGELPTCWIESSLFESRTQKPTLGTSKGWHRYHLGVF